jgi:hypothetical protein
MTRPEELKAAWPAKWTGYMYPQTAVGYLCGIDVRISDKDGRWLWEMDVSKHEGVSDWHRDGWADTAAEGVERIRAALVEYAEFVVTDLATP